MTEATILANLNDITGNQFANGRVKFSPYNSPILDPDGVSIITANPKTFFADSNGILTCSLVNGIQYNVVISANATNSDYTPTKTPPTTDQRTWDIAVPLTGSVFNLNPLRVYNLSNNAITVLSLAVSQSDARYLGINNTASYAVSASYAPSTGGSSVSASYLSGSGTAHVTTVLADGNLSGSNVIVTGGAIAGWVQCETNTQSVFDKGNIVTDGFGNMSGSSFSGSLLGSLNGTASFAKNASTSSYLSGSIAKIGTLTVLTETDTGALTVGGTLGVTGTTTTNAITANQNVTINASLIVENTVNLDSGAITTDGSGNITATSITASLKGSATTASYVLNGVSSSFASTASYVANAVSASYLSASKAIIGTLTVIASETDTGSFTVTGQSTFKNSVTINSGGSMTIVNPGTLTVGGYTQLDNGNAYTDGNGNITAVSFNGPLTGNVTGTASFATNSSTASFSSGSFIIVNQLTASTAAITGSKVSTVVLAQSNINNYAELNVWNTSTGVTASADLVCTNNSGSANTYYIDMGINSSTFTPAYVGGANDSYVYSTGSNLYVGNVTANKDLYLFAGGSINTSSVAIKSTGLVGIGLINPVNTLDVVGNISCSNITASLNGTASWATNVVNGGSGTTLVSGSTYNITSSWSNNALSASYLSASTAIIGSLTVGTTEIDSGSLVDTGTVTATNFVSNNNITASNNISCSGQMIASNVGYSVSGYGNITPFNSASVYYLGNYSDTGRIAFAPGYAVMIPMAGTIRNVFFNYRITNLDTGTHYLTSSFYVSSSNSSASLNNCVLTGSDTVVGTTGLSMAVQQGDTVMLKVQTPPTWGSQPTNIYGGFQAWVSIP